MSTLSAPMEIGHNLPPDWREKLAVRQKKKVGMQRRSKLTDIQFVEALLENDGSAYRMEKLHGVARQMVAVRRALIEEYLRCSLPRGRPETWRAQPHRTRIKIEAADAVILIGSDAHVWPEIETTAMKAFAGVNQLLKPNVVVLNGDGLDGSTISRHSRIGWDKRPTVKEEIEALADWMEHVRQQNLNARYLRTIGNHDARFDTHLATNVPGMEGVHGARLADHLPGWQECMSIQFGDVLMVKHRLRGGIHAARNNAIAAGLSIVTGHLHSPKIIPVTDYRGTRYGVDCGFLACINHPAFDYTEDAPTDWRAGFVVVTIRDGKVLPPEMAEVIDENKGEFHFRGKVWSA